MPDYEDPDVWQEEINKSSNNRTRETQLTPTGLVVRNGRALRKVILPKDTIATSISLFRVRPKDDYGRGNGIVFTTDRVILNQIGERVSEAAAVIKTFSPFLGGSDLHIQMYGQQPRIVSFSGTFFNGKSPFAREVVPISLFGLENSPDSVPDSDWYASFLYAYENILRGSKSAELGCIARVMYNYRWHHGYIIDFTTTHTSELFSEVSFGFSMVSLESGILPDGKDPVVSSRYVDAVSLNRPVYNDNAPIIMNDGLGGLA